MLHWIHSRKRVREHTIPGAYHELGTKLTIAVRILSDHIAQVRDEQSYMVLRERIHRNTAESTNARVKWWSIFQLGVLIGEGVFQVWWLKRFFEVKSPGQPSFNRGALG